MNSVKQDYFKLWIWTNEKFNVIRYDSNNPIIKTNENMFNFL